MPSVFLSFGAQPLTRYHNLSSSKHVNPGKKTRKNTRNNTLKSPKNTQNTQKNTFIFLRGNVDSHPYFPNSIPATYPATKDTQTDTQNTQTDTYEYSKTPVKHTENTKNTQKIKKKNRVKMLTLSFFLIL